MPKLEYPGDTLTFTADLMLKRLAKYLRALGYDTFFNENFSDQQLLDLSVQDKRVLLTRDNALCNATPELNSFYIKPQSPTAQLGHVAKFYPITFDESRFLVRCMECNTPLQNISKEKAAERVPERVRKRNDSFTYCPMCNQIFWQGDHTKRLRKKFLQVLSD